jgi:cysteine synthase
VLVEPTEGSDGIAEAVLGALLNRRLALTGTGPILVSHRRAPLVRVSLTVAVTAVSRRQSSWPT